MRNAILAIALIFVLIGTAIAGTIFRGPGTRLNVPCLSPMAASGAFGAADSAQVISYRDDGSSTTAVRSFTSITNMVASTGWFDSTKDAGGTNWWLNVYVDSLAGSTPTGKMVAVKVKIFTAGSWSETNFNVYVSSGQNNMMAAFDGTGGVGLYLNQLKVISTSDTSVVFATSASGKPAFANMNTNASGAAGSNGYYVSSANREAAKYYASSSSSTAANAVLYQTASSGAPAYYIYNSNGGEGIYYYDGTFQSAFLPVGYIADGVINATAIAANAIGASELADDAAREIASHILKDTTKRIGFKGGLGDSVLTPVQSVSVDFAGDTGWVTTKAWVKAVFDTIQVYDNSGRFQLVVQQILDTLQTYDNATRFQANVQELLDTIKTYDNSGRFQLLVQEILDTLKTYDNAGRFQADAQEVLDTLQNHDNWVAKEASVTKVRDSVSKLHFSGDSVVAIDPIRTVAATVSGGATEATAQKAVDSIHAVHVKVEAVRDTTHIIDSIVKFILPIVTQTRDSILTVPAWLWSRLDTIMVGMGIADSSRTTNAYLSDADTVRVYKGENLWFKFLRMHPAHVPGYRPDSTRGPGW